MRLLLGAILALSLSIGIVSAATSLVVCYHGTWSTYRWGNGKFTVEDIDPTLCTHLIYSFVGLNADGSVKLLDPYLDIDTGNFRRFNALKQANPNLKTLIAIGGWNEGSVTYSAMAADPVKRRNLITSALNLIQTHGFDGFDLDWEYPAQRGGVGADKQNYVTLLKEFRAEWDKHGLLLTAAVAASGNSVDLSYDVPALSTYLDFINVMAYDLHGPWDPVTGQNAPLYASSADVSVNQKLLNVDSAINGWIQRGADPQKLVLGLGVYGRSFTLSNPANTAVGAPASGAGSPGKFTQEGGMLGYNEICEMQLDGSWTVVWDDQQKTPYAYKNNQWVGYDNPQSIAIKVNFAKSLNLRGVMIWSIETDDFKGLAGTRYGLLTAINNALGSSGEVNPPPSSSTAAPGGSSTAASSTTTTTTTSAPASSSTQATNPSGLCQKEGYVRDPNDCSVFYYCLPSNGEYTPLKQNCSPGLYFNPVTLVCDWPANVQC